MKNRVQGVKDSRVRGFRGKGIGFRVQGPGFRKEIKKNRDKIFRQDQQDGQDCCQPAGSRTGNKPSPAAI